MLNPLVQRLRRRAVHLRRHRPAAQQRHRHRPESGAQFTWTFDLRGGPATYGVGDAMLSGYSASHLSLIGPSMRDLERADLVVVGELKVYIEPGNARGSELMKKLNPMQLYPSPDGNVRAFPGMPVHARDVGADLTADEYFLLNAMADAGGQFYSRENAPGAP